MENKDIKFEAMKKVAQTNFKIKNFKKISKLDSNSPPSVFIGSGLSYPNVNVGILSPLERDENSWLYADEKYWADKNFNIKEVLNLRQGLLNSRFKTKVSNFKNNRKFIDIAKEVALASKPVDMEIELNKNKSFGNKKDRVLTPNGLRAGLKDAKITGNVKVARSLDKMINDEIKSSDAMKRLYKKGFNEYSLNKVLSVGVLGLKKDKKLVPTRWSITATDDTLGKQLLDKVRDYKWIEDFQLFFGEFMGNQYIVLLFPDAWSYELFELYKPGSSWNPSQQLKAATDLEWFKGRTTYANNTSGGYYATRLPILEYLNQIKRQASVLVIRVETPAYWAALGVWVVRESVRKAIQKGKMTFHSKEELIESAKKISKIKFDFDNTQILNQSRLLKKINAERKLREWF